MKLNRFGSVIALVATASMALTACGGNDSPTSTAKTAASDAASAGAGAASDAASAATDTATDTATDAGTDAAAAPVSGTQNFAGASSQESAMKAWVAGFQDANPDATVNYSPDGSGAGIEKFLDGAIKLAGSDAALEAEELKKAEKVCGPEGALDLPVYISPVAVPFNLEGVEKLNLKPAVLADIFNGKITTWNDEKIKADNPDATLPDVKITAVHRSDESGTTENFMEYLSAAAPENWKHEADKKFPVAGEGAKGTSGVIQVVKSTNGAIGYTDASAVGEGLGVVSLGVGEEFVEYTPEAASAVVDASEPMADRPEGDLALELKRDTTESGNYPAVLVSYHIVCKQYDKKEDADFVKSFLTYVVSEQGQQAAADEAFSAPISAEMREKVMASIDMITAKG